MKFSKRTLNLAVLLSLVSTQLVADDKETAKPKNPRDGYYLDIGVGWGVESDPFIYDDENDSGLDLYVNARYQKNGFFVEFPHGTAKLQATILSLGYNFLNTEHWSYDIQLAMNHRDLDHKLPETGAISRRVSHSKLGFRALGDYGNTSIRFIVAGASGDQDKGYYASGWVSQQYQIENWNLYGSFGGEYRSEDVVNYFYGTNEREGLPLYRGKGGIEFTAQIGASYPITEDWVFEAFARATLLPEGISDSPLVDGRTEVKSALVVKYVF